MARYSGHRTITGLNFQVKVSPNVKRVRNITRYLNEFILHDVRLKNNRIHVYVPLLLRIRETSE